MGGITVLQRIIFINVKLMRPELKPFLFIGCAFIGLFSCHSGSLNSSSETRSDNSVRIVGAMRNVMHKGEVSGVIDLDTISNKTHLYGLGPLEGLVGEILIIDGKGYKSIVETDTTMQVTETFEMKAPFFVYANVDTWTETNLPDSVTTLVDLDRYLDLATGDLPRPFCFRLTATVERSTIHIVNLPPGTKVSSPEEAHLGQVNYEIVNEDVELAGFFSKRHKGVFTHHDTNIHVHLITADKEMMGHLDKLKLQSGTARLFLPAR